MPQQPAQPTCAAASLPPRALNPHRKTLARDFAIRLPRLLGPVLGVLLFLGALWILRRELGAYHYADIVQAIRELAPVQLAAAFALTVAGYTLLVGYDLLGLGYAGHRLPVGRVAVAAFTGYAFSNSFGNPLVTGAPIRYRFYSASGLSTFDIARVVGFSFVTFWSGVLTLGGILFLIEPLPLPSGLRLHLASARPLGALLLAIELAYLAAAAFWRRPLRIGSWEAALPELRFAAGQAVLASLDWAAAGSVLYVLLPAAGRPPWLEFLGIFLFAQIAGVLSQVPGGLGVFETVVVVLLGDRMAASAVAGSLLVYRAFYYLLPLVLGTVTLAVSEIAERRHLLTRAARLTGRWVSPLVPDALAFTTFLGGVILLVSGATPSLHSRMAWLNDVLPLPLAVVELSHFVGSLVGVGLLFLAWGLQRRLDGAYHLSVLLLATGIVVSLLKGLDYEEAIALAVMLALLVSARDHFYRKASLGHDLPTARWFVAMGVVVLASVWLGAFAFKHVEYSDQLWWRFSIHGDAPRFLRASVGAVVLTLVLALTRLMRPARPEPEALSPELRRCVDSVVEASPRSDARLAYLDDKSFLLAPSARAFIMYAIQGSSWVAMGDPVGPHGEWADLIWRFRELADKHAGRPIFYQVGPENLPVYVEAGLTLLKLGEEALVPLATFSLEGGERKKLRYVHRKLTADGFAFTMIAPEDVPGLLPELARVSDRWLEEKGVREKRFSLGRFDPEYLKRLPMAVVRREGRVYAFANLWPGAGLEEVSVDLMRHLPEAPAGVMDFLFTELLLWGRDRGYRWFNLGMAPLSGLQAHPLAPVWNRLGAFLFSHGEPIYHFQGLRHYKEKFEPAWRPRYLASPGGLALPRALADVTALVSGGLTGVLGK